MGSRQAAQALRQNCGSRQGVWRVAAQPGRRGGAAAGREARPHRRAAGCGRGAGGALLPGPAVLPGPRYCTPPRLARTGPARPAPPPLAAECPQTVCRSCQATAARVMDQQRQRSSFGTGAPQALQRAAVQLGEAGVRQLRRRAAPHLLQRRCSQMMRNAQGLLHLPSAAAAAASSSASAWSCCEGPVVSP